MSNNTQFVCPLLAWIIFLGGCDTSSQEGNSDASAPDSKPSVSTTDGNPRLLLKKIVKNAVANSEEALKASGLWESGFGNPEFTRTDTGAKTLMRKAFKDGSGSSSKSLGIKLVDYEYISTEKLAKITFELYEHTYIDGSIGPKSLNIDLSNAYKVNWRYEVTLIYDSGSFVMDKLTWQANETDGSWKKRPVVRNLSASPSIKVLFDGQIEF